MLEFFPFIWNKKKLESRKKVCGNKDFFNAEMPSEYKKILKFNHYHVSGKVPFIIYADLEYLTEKIDGCKNNTENSSTTKVGEHILSRFSMSAISLLKSIENKHDV